MKSSKFSRVMEVSVAEECKQLLFSVNSHIKVNSTKGAGNDGVKMTGLKTEGVYLHVRSTEWLRGRSENSKKGICCMSWGTSGHFTACCSPEGHIESTLPHFSAQEGHPKGHFATFCPFAGHPARHLITF